MHHQYFAAKTFILRCAHHFLFEYSTIRADFADNRLMSTAFWRSDGARTSFPVSHVPPVFEYVLASSQACSLQLTTAVHLRSSHGSGGCVRFAGRTWYGVLRSVLDRAYRPSGAVGIYSSKQQLQFPVGARKCSIWWRGMRDVGDGLRSQERRASLTQ